MRRYQKKKYIYKKKMVKFSIIVMSKKNRADRQRKHSQIIVQIKQGLYTNLF